MAIGLCLFPRYPRSSYIGVCPFSSGCGPVCRGGSQQALNFGLAPTCSFSILFLAQLPRVIQALFSHSQLQILPSLNFGTLQQQFPALNDENPKKVLIMAALDTTLGGILSLCIVFMFLTTTTIVLRFAARHKQKANYQVDDWMIVAAWVHFSMAWVPTPIRPI